jgi:hypothetical protein
MKNDEDIFASEKESEVKTPVVPVKKSIAVKPKQEYKILSIGKKYIALSYMLNGIECGMSIPFEEKYKNKKAGDSITL